MVDKQAPQALSKHIFNYIHLFISTINVGTQIKIQQKRKQAKIIVCLFPAGYSPRLDNWKGKRNLPPLTYGKESHRSMSPVCQHWTASHLGAAQLLLFPSLGWVGWEELGQWDALTFAPFQWILRISTHSFCSSRGLRWGPTWHEGGELLGDGLLLCDPLVSMECQIKIVHEPVLDYSLFSLYYSRDGAPECHMGRRGLCILGNRMELQDWAQWFWHEAKMAGL